MGKRKGDQPTPSPQAQDQAPQAQDLTAGVPATTTPPSDLSAAPALASASAEAATPLPSAPSFVTIDATNADAPKADATKADAPQTEAADTEPPAASPKPIVLYRVSSRDEAAAAEDADAAATAEKTSSSSPKMRRFLPLAASIAIAAAVGAMAGSAATAGLGGLRASPAPAKSADLRPLRDTIAHLNTELAALKASVDNSGRTSHVQLTKLGDRLDRVERAQAEPTAKLTKLAEAVDRIEHRAPAPTNSAQDVTGSITAPATQLAAAAAARPNSTQVLDGWSVRSVYRGAALLQTRYGGIIEVERGDNLPGLGRIENIRRQDGRWVVVTSRGTILAR